MSPEHRKAIGEAETAVADNTAILQSVGAMLDMGINHGAPVMLQHAAEVALRMLATIRTDLDKVESQLLSIRTAA